VIIPAEEILRNNHKTNSYLTGTFFCVDFPFYFGSTIDAKRKSISINRLNTFEMYLAVQIAEEKL
jgi:hypothetical protein